MLGLSDHAIIRQVDALKREALEFRNPSDPTVAQRESLMTAQTELCGFNLTGETVRELGVAITVYDVFQVPDELGQPYSGETSSEDRELHPRPCFSHTSRIR